MAEVVVLKQSEVILANPSDYWISVINAGRSFPLSHLRAVFRKLELGPGVGDPLEPLLKQALADADAAVDAAGVMAAMQKATEAALAEGFGALVGSRADLERVLRAAVSDCEAAIKAAKGGEREACLSSVRRACDQAMDLGFSAAHVVTSLMHVADVLATGIPSSSSSSPQMLSCTAALAPLHELAVSYMRSAEPVLAAGLKTPEVLPRRALLLRLKVPPADGAPVDDPDAELTLLDGPPDVQRKIKRAFCEPANVSFCPPLALAVEIVLAHADSHTLVVKEATYSDGGALEADFASGVLHPGDLKPAVTTAVDGVMERLRVAIKAEPKLGAAVKEVQKVLKRATQKGGGKGK